MTDVWTSVGVVAGVVLTAATGWLILDPLIALAVAAHIVWTGFMLMRRSFSGLLDAAIPANELADIESIFAEYRKREGVAFHALLTRQAGARRFISFHLLVPDAWPVDRAHDLSEEIEKRIRAQVPKAITLTHIEPISQPASYEDIELER
jgi:cation diffusion facilitator family transporter